MAKKDEATTAATSLVVNDENLPAHLEGDKGLGNENVSGKDMTIPRIKLLQSLSPEVDKSKPEFIEGAEPGMYMRTTDKALMTEFMAINVKFSHGYALFIKRSFGGGFKGEFSTPEDAWAKAIEDNGTKETAEKMCDVVETGRHLLLVVDPETGELSPALMDFSKTALKVSSDWNTTIHSRGGARFSTIYRVKPKSASNSKGSWTKPDFEVVGWCTPELYEQAKSKYNELKDALVRADDEVTDKDD